MKINDEIPAGTYVKVKSNLEIEWGNKYGRSIVPDMLLLRGKIYQVTCTSTVGNNEITIVHLRNPITNKNVVWEWTPIMLELASNDDIKKIKEEL